VPKRPGCAPFAARAQSDRDWEQYKALDADQLALAACTRLIEANRLAGHDIAVAYWLRGKMDWRLREFGVAIADEEGPSRSIRTSPTPMRRGALLTALG
jgi:hypothetical protein